jgi:hypothetical protein
MTEARIAAWVTATSQRLTDNTEQREWPAMFVFHAVVVSSVLIAASRGKTATTVFVPAGVDVMGHMNMTDTGYSVTDRGVVREGKCRELYVAWTT